MPRHALASDAGALRSPCRDSLPRCPPNPTTSARPTGRKIAASTSRPANQPRFRSEATDFAPAHHAAMKPSGWRLKYRGDDGCRAHGYDRVPPVPSPFRALQRWRGGGCACQPAAHPKPGALALAWATAVHSQRSRGLNVRGLPLSWQRGLPAIRCVEACIRSWSGWPASSPPRLPEPSTAS